jgi:hypothetical protein
MSSINSQCKAGNRRNGKPRNSRGAVEVEITIDGKPRFIPVDDLMETARADEVASDLAGAKAPPTIALDRLLDWTDDQRFRVLDFLASLGCPYEVQLASSTFTDLFAAALSLICSNGKDLARARAAKQAAMEVAVLKYGDALDLAIGRHPHGH